MGNSAARPWQTTIRTRVIVAAVCFAAWSVAIEARLVWLQVYQHDAYLSRAARQQKDTVEVPARRGEIVDRQGHTLALSVNAETIVAARNLDNPESTVDAICRALDGCTKQERDQYVQRLGPKNRKGFTYLRRQISPEEAARVSALNLPGISLITESKRFYPKRELAAHVLGFVGPAGKGLGGIEAAYDSRIRGRDGALLVETDARRRRFSQRIERSPTAGATIELTIDQFLQYATERELRRAVRDQHAAGGTIIIMDPRTGEILALANEPTFNPNAFGDARPEDRRNRAVQELYEPGSTFKMVTASAAIEEQAFRIDEPIDVSAGSIQIGSRGVKDVHRYGVLSFTDVIVKSSNVGAIKVGLRLGPERLGRYIRRFGFGTRLCPDIQGETVGMLSDPGRWGDSTLASVSMGYEIGVTPLQMVTAFSSVANGGLLVQPRIVRAIRQGSLRSEIAPLELRRTVNADTAAELVTIMEQVVARGTATAGAIPGYTVAGKTGTAARLVDQRYSKTDYYSSFVGFVPSRQPALTILVVIDSPHNGLPYGGLVAAPVFKRIAEAALRQLGIPPTVNPVPPVMVNVSAGDARVGGVTPTTARATGSHVDLITGPPVVPDVRGLGAREAILRLARFGLVARLTGDGVVIDQDPAAGTPIEPGSACRLWLERIVVLPPAPVSLQ